MKSQLVLSSIVVTSVLFFSTYANPTVAQTQSPDSQPNWHTLFDGRTGAGSLDGWKMIGPGNFVVDADGSLRSEGGMGLFYYAEQAYEDFELEVEWKVANKAANSGVFLRFPRPDDPWDAVEGGYEIQIDDTSPDDRATGSVYSFAAAQKFASNPPGEWNRFVIKVQGQQYSIDLNGEHLTDFVGSRSSKGHVGLQNHDPNSTTWFRLVRIRPLAVRADPTAALAEQFATDAAPIRVLTVTKTHAFRHTSAIEQTKKLLAALNETTEFQFTITEDLDDLTPRNLENYDVLFFANATLRVDEPDVVQENVVTFRAGDWKNYAGVLDLPARPLNGKLALSGNAENITGLAEFSSGAQKIQSAVIEHGTMTLSWGEGSQVGNVRAEINFSDPNAQTLTGFVHAAGLKIPLTLTAVESEAVQTWDIDQPLTQAHRDAILDFMAQGKGFAGAHSALDALYGWSDYREMVGGGLFVSHPWTQPVAIDIEDKKNATTAHFGHQLEIRDEIYVLDENPRWTSHVLTSLDRSSVTSDPGPADASRSDFPISWLREFNGGRVFMTKLGHFPDVWTNPEFVQHLLQGLRTAAGRIPSNYAIKRIKETIAPNVWPDD